MRPETAQTQTSTAQTQTAPLAVAPAPRRTPRAPFAPRTATVTAAAPAVVTVALASYNGTDGSSFALNSADLLVGVRAADESRSDLHNLIDAFEYLLVHPHFVETPVEILVVEESFASAVAPLLAAWPRFTVRTVAADGYLMHRAQRMAERVIEPHEHPFGISREDAQAAREFSDQTPDDRTPDDQTARPRTRLTCATDGSVGFRRAQRSAYGWVTESGQHGAGVLSGSGSSTARTAELVAVAELLENTSTTRPLRVLIDCAEVLTLVRAIAAEQEEQRAGGVAASQVAEPTYLAPWNQSAARRIARALDGRDVIWEKVRAHSGHPLNDTADRLAVQARRAEQMGVEDSVAETVRQRILAEGLWAWSQHQAAQASAASL